MAEPLADQIMRKIKQSAELYHRLMLVVALAGAGKTTRSGTNYDRRMFREALVNALVHRDFARLGAVHIRLDDDGLTMPWLAKFRRIYFRKTPSSSCGTTRR